MIENLKCPDCGGPMTSRKNNSTGQRFWGCNNYPTCRGTRNTDGDARMDYRRERASDDLDSSLPSDRQRQNDKRRW